MGQAQRAGDSLAQAGGLGGPLKKTGGLKGRARGLFSEVRYVLARPYRPAEFPRQ
jgi:hypothetical protein